MHMRLFYANLFLLYFSCSSQAIWAQSPCEGRVRDAKTLQALPSVYIRNLRTQKTVLSDPDGKFQLAAQPGDRIEARLLGYQLEQLSYQGQPSGLPFQKSFGCFQ